MRVERHEDRPQRRTGHAQWKTEDNHLQNVTPGHGVKDALRNELFEHCPKTDRRHGATRRASRQGHPETRPEPERQQSAQQQSRDCHGHKVAKRPESEPAGRPQVSGSGQRGDQRAEDQRSHDGPDRPQKDGAEGSQVPGNVRRQQAEEHPGNKANDNPERLATLLEPLHVFS